MFTRLIHRPLHPGLRRNLFLSAAWLQIGCGLFFAVDVAIELKIFTFHALIESLAVIGLGIGAYLTLRDYRSMLHRNTKVERELNVVSGAFQEEVERHFGNWGLTAAERDVALLSIKGVPLADIAAIRSTREGTIKAQSAAIYRKAGVSGRAELISVVVEELISGLNPRGDIKA